MIFNTIESFRAGDRVRHVTLKSVGVVTERVVTDNGQIHVHWEKGHGSTVGGSTYGAFPENLEILERAPARPLIDFSASRYATAREYAALHISRVNKPETNEALQTVTCGGQVDAYALTRAVADAMRHVATRFGQSMARRRAGEQVAHLGHIAHAVIENHADGLPVYEPGERSRVAAEARRAAADAEASLADVTKRAEREAERRRRAEQEVVDVRKNLSDLQDSLFLEINETHAALDYAFSFLTEEQKSRVAGFRDGYATRVNDEA